MEREIRILMGLMIALLVLALIPAFLPRAIAVPPAAEILELELHR